MASFGGHSLHPGEGVPLFIAAGVLKEPAQLEVFKGIEDPNVVPVLTLGSFTLKEWGGNAGSGQQDFVYYPDLGMAGNARGLPNPGKDGIKALEETVKELEDRGIKTILSVTNLPSERPVDVIPDLVEIGAEAGFKRVEVNLSCPNGLDNDGNLHPPTCNNPDASAEVMSRAKERVGDDIALGAKDSPHVTSLEDRVDQLAVRKMLVAVRPYIDFLTGINTIGGQPFAEITCAGGKGGLSGPVVAEIAKEHLRIAHEVAPELAYLSTGGVDSANAKTEIAARRGLGALLVGGAQEFYRASQPYLLVERWAQSV